MIEEHVDIIAFEIELIPINCSHAQICSVKRAVCKMYLLVQNVRLPMPIYTLI